MNSGIKYLAMTISSSKTPLNGGRRDQTRLQNTYCRRWVSPFGNSRIKACSQLPKTYRSVPRPSSPLGAKASTERPYCTSSLPLSMSATRQAFMIWEERPACSSSPERLRSSAQCSGSYVSQRQDRARHRSVWL